jgi:hypothetical protein
MQELTPQQLYQLLGEKEVEKRMMALEISQQKEEISRLQKENEQLQQKVDELIGSQEPISDS